MGANDHGTELREAIDHDVVLLSNVLNVQETIEDIEELLDSIRDNVTAGTRLVCNLPASPRYGNYDTQDVRIALESAGFSILENVGKASAPVWSCIAR